MKANAPSNARPRAKRQFGQSALPLPNLDVGQLRDNFQFLRGFARNPAQVGSVVPSSRYLEQRLVREARIAEARTVVELGPGTGGTTAAFLRAMSPAARLLAIELDPEFHRHLCSSLDDPASSSSWAAPSGWRISWPRTGCRRPTPSSPAFLFRRCRAMSPIGSRPPSRRC